MAAVEVPNSTEDDVTLEVEPLIASAGERVFTNELLLDKILNFAVLNGNKVCMKTANACKLVQRQWLKRVTTNLWKSQWSNFHVELEDFYKISQQQSQVERFVTTFENSPSHRLPPFSLNVKPTSFTIEMVTSLYNCLSRCGSGLVDFTFHLGVRIINEEANPLVFPPAPENLNLPELDKLQLIMPCDRGPEFRLGGAHDRETTLLLQAILTGAKNLTFFSLVNAATETEQVERLPVDFQGLILPDTLTEIILEHGISASHLEQLLLSNSLPDLTKLTLCVVGDSFKGNTVLFRILDHFRDQLIELDIVGNDYSDDVPITPIHLPVMENLEEFGCEAANYEWATTTPRNLQQYFPSLKKMTLRCQTFEMLRRWIHSARYESVEELIVTLDPNTSHGTNEEWLLLQQAHRLTLAFPNISKFSVSIPLQKAPLKFFFQEMRQLQELDIECPDNMTANLLSSLLVGISPKVVSAFEAMREIWSHVEFIHAGMPSIVHLTELKKLSLYACPARGTYVISDVVFRYAFFKMPNLRELSLLGKLKASPEMLGQWLMDGRILNNLQTRE